MRVSAWRPSVKFGLVAVGYAAALAIALGVVAIRVAETSGPVAQASSGMYAFGDLLTFLAVFGAGSLVPTGLGIYFLWRTRYFWPVIVVLGLGIVLSIAAVVLFIVSVTGA
jgi:hypothetical protein